MVVLCVLCLKSTNIETNKKSNLLKVLLKMLSLDPWWNATGNPTLCSHCISIITKALDFKMNCVATEKTLSPYVKKNTKVDLCSVYMKKVKNEKSGSWGIMKICRLCIRLIENFDYYLLDFLEHSHFEEIFKKYLPEMELSKFEEPLICEQCIKNFRNFADFIISCMDTKNKIKKYCEAVHISTTKLVDLKDVLRHSMKNILGGDVCYKLEKKARSNGITEPLLLISHVKEEYDADTDVDVESLDHPSEDQLKTKGKELTQNVDHLNFFIQTKQGKKKCKHCDFTNSCNAKIKLHVIRKHADLYNFPVFECDKCDYKSTDKCYMKRHSSRHSLEAKIFSCDKCLFRTINKASFKGHSLVHKGPKEVPTYKCEICNFSTKYKGGLGQHMKIHMDRSKIGIFKCDLEGCNYSTIERSYLTKHIKRHMTPCIDKEETMLKCMQCSFKTEYKKHLRTHIQQHRDGKIDETLLRCEHNYCKYKTRMEDKLDEHYTKEHQGKC